MSFQSQMCLSIIVTSYTIERLKEITELMDSILVQTYRNIETVFIVERSEELYEKIKEYKNMKKIPNVKIIFDEHKLGLSLARNIGIKHAVGEILAFVGDDVILSPRWAEEVLKTFYIDDSIIGITGSVDPLWEDTSFDWLPEELYWIISCTAWCDFKEIKETRNAWGMNMAFRREAFDSCSFPTAFGSEIRWREGSIFSRKITAEEVVFSFNVKKQTGKRIFFNPRVNVKHNLHGYRLEFSSIAKKSYLIGCERRMLKKLYRQTEMKTEVLSMEYDLINRLGSRLLPKMIKCFFRKPNIALRQFQVLFTALFFAALGYLSYN